MNVASLWKTNSDNSLGLLSATMAIREKISSQIERIKSFLLGSASVLSIPFTLTSSRQVSNTRKSGPRVRSNVMNFVGCISSNQYDDAIAEAADQFAVRINDVGDTVQVTRDELLSAFDDLTAELRAQEIFLEGCQASARMSVSDFCTRIATEAEGIGPEVISRYTSLLNQTDSNVSALYAFFVTNGGSDVVSGTEDSYIEIIRPDLYSGSAFASALVSIGSSTLNFFAGVLKTITNLQTAIKTIANAVKTGLQWMTGRLFRNLALSYTAVSDSPVGILDVPWASMVGSTWSDYPPFATYSDYEVAYGECSWILTRLMRWGYRTISNADYHVVTNFPSYAWESGTQSAQSENAIHLMATGLANLFVDHQDDGYRKKVTEIVIPAEPYSSVVRVGFAPDDASGRRVAISIHFILTSSDLEKYNSDSALETDLKASMLNAIRVLNQLCPLIPIRDAADGVKASEYNFRYEYTTGKTGWLFDGRGTKSWVQRLLMLNIPSTNLSAYNTDPDTFQADSDWYVIPFWRAVFMYLLLNGPGISVTSTVALAATDWMYGAHPSSQGAYKYVPSSVDLDDASFSSLIFSNDVFRPYASSCLMPITSHYQTTAEQSAEIVNAIKYIVIATVIVIVAVKVAKWRKNRSAMTKLANENVSRLAWEAGQNPSQANMTAYQKAFNKARRMEAMNSILGIGTNTAASKAASSIDLSQTIFGSAKTTSQDVSNVQSSVTGVGLSVGQVSTKVTDVGTAVNNGFNSTDSMLLNIARRQG